MHDLKFAPQKTAQIPISRGDEVSFSDMILNLAINFEQNSKDSDLARSKAARSQDAQTAHGQNFNGARRFSSDAQEAPGGAQKIASGGEGILKFRPPCFIRPALASHALHPHSC